MSIFDNVTFMNEENYHNGPEYREYKRKEEEKKDEESRREWEKFHKFNDKPDIGIRNKKLYDASKKGDYSLSGLTDKEKKEFEKDMDAYQGITDRLKKQNGGKYFDQNPRNMHALKSALRKARNNRDEYSYSANNNQQSNNESAGIFESVEII